MPVQLETNTFGKRNKGQNKFEGCWTNRISRHVAISRLFLDNVDHIQASGLQWEWVLLRWLFSPGQMMGSTMMEENVVSASGTTKFSATEYELQLSIRRAGFLPVRRNSDYDRLDTPNALAGSPEVMCKPPLHTVELV